MNHIYLEHHDPDKNLHRFYQLIIMPGLFDDWSLVREWGRIGSPGIVRKDWFDCELEALEAAEKVFDAKRKKGYRVIIEKLIS
jgi:predicted DNA-binding WGR domain protein